MLKVKLTTPVLAWTALLANGLVILQGAVVRATGSGAGCGSHWPSCNGEFIPLGHSLETMIEFSHRLLSLSVLVLGAWLVWRAFLSRQEKPGLWAFALAAFGFLIMEALLGAATVLLGLTGENASFGRGIMVASHLVNSLLLVGMLALTVVYARDDAPAFPLKVRSQPLLATVLAVGVFSMLFLMFSGGIAAMGNTMFPSASLREGIAADFDPNSHPIIRLRILHPLVALTVGFYLFASLGLGWWMKPVQQAKRLVQWLFGVYAAQVVIGTANLALLAPIVLQLLHLSTAVLAFALLSAISAYTLGYPVSPVASPVPGAVSLPRPEMEA